MGASTGGFADYSGTATGTSAEIIGGEHYRQYLLIQNQDAGTDVLWVNFGAPATTTPGDGSFKLVAGASLIFEGEHVPSTSVNVIGSAADVPFAMWEG